MSAQTDAKSAIDSMLDEWHLAAANADFDAYFGLMTDNGVFLGTAATENWLHAEFRTFSKPYFERGKAWSFAAVERNIYLDANGETAWFDEVLDTQMKLCRGSGVVKKIDDEWKVAHYVLSIAVPNENVKALVAIKKDRDSVLLQQFKSKLPE